MWTTNGFSPYTSSEKKKKKRKTAQAWLAKFLIMTVTALVTPSSTTMLSIWALSHMGICAHTCCGIRQISGLIHLSLVKVCVCARLRSHGCGGLLLAWQNTDGRAGIKPKQLKSRLELFEKRRGLFGSRGLQWLIHQLRTFQITARQMLITDAHTAAFVPPLPPCVPVMGAAGDSGFNLDPFNAHTSGNVSRVERHINSFLQLDEAAAAQDINNSSVLRVGCLATAAGHWSEGKVIPVGSQE